MACTDSNFYLLRSNGSILQVNLSTLMVTAVYQLASENITKIFVNQNDQHIAYLDSDKKLKIYSVNGAASQWTHFERKEVAQFCWATDHPDWFSLVEKAKVYVFKNNDLMESFQMSGYIYAFNKLEISSLLLDDLQRHPNLKTPVVSKTLQVLESVESFMKKKDWNSVNALVIKQDHPYLWKTVGEFAFRNLKFDVAQKCFARLNDYASVSALKSVLGYDVGRFSNY